MLALRMSLGAVALVPLLICWGVACEGLGYRGDTTAAPPPPPISLSLSDLAEDCGTSGRCFLCCGSFFQLGGGKAGAVLLACFEGAGVCWALVISGLS